MSSTKLLSVLLAVVAVSALALGSAGFSSVSADRSVSVSVADNENAYVGVAACELGADKRTENANKAKQNGGSASQVRLWVGNNFTSPFTVKRISSGADSRYPGFEVEPGELIRFNALDDAGSLTVYVAGEESSFSVEVTVDVVPKAACPFDRQSGDPVAR